MVLRRWSLFCISAPEIGLTSRVAGRLSLLTWLIAAFLRLAAGAKLDADDCERTPLWLAARHGRLSVVQLLVKENADPSHTDKDGTSVLAAATATQKINEEIIMVLLVSRLVALLS